ncbi:MAG: hypothetical protein M1503_12310 [Thaumarchaeota archaeon]|nr:hypothetical protein [Nitrososphaerota archaeon]MCL5319023.1 hypothetical protein [Nitrososphaerota archaeon]
MAIALLSGIPAIRSVYKLNLAEITKEQVIYLFRLINSPNWVSKKEVDEAMNRYTWIV